MLSRYQEQAVPKTKISKATVDGATTQGGKATAYGDEKLPGFGLTVHPSGSKTFIYRYRIAAPGRAADTAPKKYTIGKHGALTPDQARSRA